MGASRMKDAIFLAAGVPDPRRGPEFAATADTVAITAAVLALVHVVLGRRPLVWGGQPAITPMVLVVADEIGVDYGQWVHLYQSRFFQDEFPEDNVRFANVTFTDAFQDDREASLSHMRTRMFNEIKFSSAVFIGGMGGIVEEYNLIRHLQPKTTIVPVTSTGGASLKVAEALGGVPPDLSNDRDYIALFHRHLDVSVREKRFTRPADQPREVTDRYWQPGDKA